MIRAGPAVITTSLNVAQSSIRHKNEVENKRLAITNESKIRSVSLAAMPFKRVKAPGRYAHLYNPKRKFCNAEKSQRYLTEGSRGARIPFYKPDS